MTGFASDPLPTDFEDDDPGHTAAANATNERVNEVGEAVDTLTQDTGWRKITGAGAAGDWYLRRVGNQVTLLGNPGYNEAPPTLTVPEGFRPMFAPTGAGTNALSVAAHADEWIAYQDNFLTVIAYEGDDTCQAMFNGPDATSGAINGSVNYPTVDAFPNPLPGTAV